ncbi:LysR family transcriptional regulator [Treponema brennaborense]|uniref:Transcriptional regulator, LysR family n=1 Tax=Treponema brennaborense (strain DSM 12168 / CIP 105900 / DD5/3) TaxID=906968 RepID=F4LLK6_TREBD|nr:LysR family transcriptional regulator [Treponema brennaborense]AEE16670.1 transcriptional regulator, LysR family [Treponema brennaborense DSM 12168]
MTLQQLKYVLAVAETKNISEAARSLHLSQPSLSAAVRELETELGFAVFLRTNRGITVTGDGSRFLGYARQVIEQERLLAEKYLNGKPRRQHFAVSSQHYSFAVNAFVDVIKEFGNAEYEFTLRETRTYEIIEDVHSGRSELGILYINDFNEPVLSKLIRDCGLTFTALFTAQPHVFISKTNPLAPKTALTMEDLAPYPFLSFEQGEHNSFHFSEEILSTHHYDKMIKVSDRATLFNLLIGLDGYTLCTGIISEQLNGPNIIARPLLGGEPMHVGTITLKDRTASRVCASYLKALQKHIQV